MDHTFVKRFHVTTPMPHAHHGHDHPHHVAADTGHARQLWIAFALTLGFAAVEAAAGAFAGSLALLADSGHMFADSVALALAAVAARLAQRPPGPRHSYGFARVEVLAALVNGVLMLVVVATITVEAVQRLQSPQAVAGGVVLATAMVGLIINTVVAAMLARGAANLNTRAALLHVMSDLLGSVAALLAGAIVLFTGYFAADAWLSLAIGALILFSTLKLLREALHVLMEGVPLHLDLARVGQRMAGVAGVVSVHDLHIWTAVAGRVALSAHVVIREMSAWPRVLSDIEALLAREFDIHHVTLQPEPGAKVVPLHRAGKPPPRY